MIARYRRRDCHSEGKSNSVKQSICNEKATASNYSDKFSKTTVLGISIT